jgi:hypothetical protein
LRRGSDSNSPQPDNFPEAGNPEVIQKWVSQKSELVLFDDDLPKSGLMYNSSESA